MANSLDGRDDHHHQRQRAQSSASQTSHSSDYQSALDRTASSSSSSANSSPTSSASPKASFSPSLSSKYPSLRPPSNSELTSSTSTVSRGLSGVDRRSSSPDHDPIRVHRSRSPSPGFGAASTELTSHPSSSSSARPTYASRDRRLHLREQPASHTVDPPQHSNRNLPSTSATSSFAPPPTFPTISDAKVERSQSPKHRRLTSRHGLPPASFKRARTSSPYSDAPSSPPATTSDTEDNESSTGASVSRQASHFGPSALRRDFSSEWTHTMSDAGSVGGLLEEGALRLDDNSPAITRPTTPAHGESKQDHMVEMAASETAPPVEEQRSAIEPATKAPLRDGETRYLLSRVWFKRWSSAVAAEEAAESAEEIHVGPIDCSDLCDPSSGTLPPILAQNLEEGAHFVLITPDGWARLASWYGVRGPIFQRSVIPVSGESIVEVYVPTVAFSEIVSANAAASIPASSTIALAKVSRIASLTEVRKVAIAALQLSDTNEDSTRLWCLPPGSEPKSRLLAGGVTKAAGYALVEETGMTEPLRSILDRLPTETFPIGVEVKAPSGKWPTDTAAALKNVFANPGGDYFSKVQAAGNRAGPSRLTPASSPEPDAGPSARTTRSKTAHQRSSGRTKGLKGLNNLGNTCFMNSALQCLSNTPELKNYFVSRVFEQEINEDNPLGNGGALASAFGGLMRELWSGNGTSYVPREFKYSLARFAPQFSGYAQQDTQELLAFLLDGLHEDLNRIKKKPYVEAPDWEGGGLEEMVRFAKKQWEIYKMRNDSVIVDLFQGQYRSTLVCPECSKVSIKFDPFMYLTLPLPSKTMWRHKVTFIPFDPQEPIKVVNVALSAESSIAKLKTSLAETLGKDAKRIVGAELWSNKIYRFYFDYEPVHSIERNDHAFFWELPVDYKLANPKASGNSNRYYTTSPPVEQPKEEEAAGRAPPPGFDEDEHVVMPVFTVNRQNSVPLGAPFFVVIRKEDTDNIAKIQEALIEQYARYSPNASELHATFNASVPTSSTPASNDWEMVEETAQPVEPVEGDADVVAEFRADGQVIETRDYDSIKERAANSGIVQLAGGSADSSTSGLFQTHYLVNTSPTRPMIKDAERLGRSGEDLQERMRRLQFDRAERPDDAQIPLVYRGGALVCAWDPHIFDRHFKSPHSDGLWGVRFEDLDDARVAAEKAEGPAARRSKKQLNIEDCLDEFTKEERLGEDDPWYCPQCKDFRQATKKFDLWKVPDILVVHLKRFSAGRGLRDKIDTDVDFPIEGLDLTHRVEGTKAVQSLKAQGKAEDLTASLPGCLALDTSRQGEGDGEIEDLSASILSTLSEVNDDAVASDQPIYDLFAVDNHYGGLGGGHYTASARNADDKQWYYFDDSSVRPMSNADEVKGSAAYLLFYRRRTTRPIGGKSREITLNAVAKEAAADADSSGVTLADDTMRGNVDDDDLDSPPLGALGHFSGQRLAFGSSRRSSSDSPASSVYSNHDDNDDSNPRIPGAFGLGTTKHSPPPPYDWSSGSNSKPRSAAGDDDDDEMAASPPTWAIVGRGGSRPSSPDMHLSSRPEKLSHLAGAEEHGYNVNVSALGAPGGSPPEVETGYRSDEANGGSSGGSSADFDESL